MGRTAEPRSWRQQDYLADESAPAVGTSSRTPLLSPRVDTVDRRHNAGLVARPTSSILDSWLLHDAAAPEAASTTVTEQLRRSVLPASNLDEISDQRNSTLLGERVSEPDSTNGTNVHRSNVRTSRSATNPWTGAWADIQDYPDSSTMLPPRLGTPAPPPVPALSSSAGATYQSMFESAADALPAESTFEEGLTSTGTRGLARHRLRMLEAERRNAAIDSVSSLDLRTLQRARAAVEGSRLVLEHARMSIRTALRDSESRLGRLADLLRNQLQNESGDILPPLPISTDIAENEVERTEYNLEQSLLRLRAASLEIDRVLAATQDASSSFTVQSASEASTVRRPRPSGTGDGVFSTLFPNVALPSLRQSESYDAHSDSQPGSLNSSSPGNGSPESVDPSLRQPMPRRPVRYLRGSQIPSLLSVRSRVSSQETAASRANRPPRSTSNRGLAIQVSLVGYANDSTSNLARNVLTNLPQRTSASNEDSHLFAYVNDSIEQQLPQSRPTGSRHFGRWIRLDANGDELIGSPNNSIASLGWSWAPMSSLFVADEDKSASLPPLGDPNNAGNGYETFTSTGAEGFFNGDLIGR